MCRLFVVKKNLAKLSFSDFEIINSKFFKNAGIENCDDATNARTIHLFSDQNHSFFPPCILDIYAFGLPAINFLVFLVSHRVIVKEFIVLVKIGELKIGELPFNIY